MTQRITIFSAMVATMFFFCLAVTSAQITESKLVPSDGMAYGYFGNSVSISSDYALIGASWDDDNGENAGAAYIFHHDGTNWGEQSKLLPSDGLAYRYFGNSVSISSDYALIGVIYDDDNGNSAGSAYIFHYDGTNWMEQSKLLASDGAPLDHFGLSVSLSGDYALVGAFGDDNGNGQTAGAAYVFHRGGSNWMEQSKLIASDGDPSDRFGLSVSLSGDHALIGASWDDDNRDNAGAAYIFHYDGASWVEQSKLLASDGASGDWFGTSVSISGDFALIGAIEDDDNGNSSGAAYIFHYDGTNWVEQAKLLASDGVTDDQFGYSVSLSGHYALIGAAGVIGGSKTGSAYFFHYNGSSWVEQTKLIASDGYAEDFFGGSVSLSGDYALVGASRDDNSIGGNAGAAYVYSASPVCDKVSQFQARCRAGGLIKARVTMEDASHAGDVIEISIDGVPYEVTIDATGRGQLSQGGFSPGPHTVELTNPGQCLDPIAVTCRTSLDEIESDDWDDELISESPTETALVGQPAFGLAGNYPNPFNPSTTIRYMLSNDGPVSIRVYNMLGQEVATLVDGFQKAGEQSVVWHGVNNFGQGVASGLYVYRLQTGSTVMSQKMLFAK